MKTPKINNAVVVLMVAMAVSSAVFAGSVGGTPEDVILAKGFSAFMDGNFKSAQGYFEEVVRINPHNKAAQNGLSKVKVRLKKLESDERARNRVLSLAKHKEGRSFLKTNDLIGAIDSFHQAVDATPQFHPAMKELKAVRRKTEKLLQRKNFNPSEYAFSLGVLAYLDRDWSKAYRLWSQRQKIEPNNVVIANAAARAESHFKQMMFAEKEEFFRRSARVLYEEGFYQRAKDSWKHVLGILPSDLEAIEGLARSEREIARIEGKGRNEQFNALLEEALDDLATQRWARSKEKFIQLAQLDPNFKTAEEYITHINNKLSEKQYVPAGANVASSDGWRQAPVQPVRETVSIDEKENYVERIKRLESLVKRNPSDIRAQQDLDALKKEQEEEAERVYKDGLIAYSQENRDDAIIKWKHVLLIQPEHQKAQTALKKARAEQERTAAPEGAQ